MYDQRKLLPSSPKCNLKYDKNFFPQFNIHNNPSAFELLFLIFTVSVLYL
jgi:hypothetical protein